jgi:peptidoglycan/LPS O-acetylase OafA/YrhL
MKLYETYVGKLASQWKIGWVYRLVAWTGVYSYSIYLVHLKAGPMITNFLIESFVTKPSHIVVSLMMILFNVICGYILSLLIEQPFLRLREKLFPGTSV